MKASWNTIVVGASFYGCGRAAAEADSLVLDPCCQVGSDFVFSFDSGIGWETPPAHPWATEFQQGLRAHEVLKGERLQVGRLAPAFAKWCLEHKLRVLLLSRILERDGQRITALTPSGVQTFTAETIIDAQPTPTGPRRLTALASHPPETARTGACGPFTISPGPSPDESFLRLDLPEDTTWPEARSAMHQAWLGRPTELGEWRLALIASRFAQTRFPNPVLALDAGLRRVMP
jgi:hypothetical protein